MPKFHIHRSIQISAPASKVFQTVADYGTWTSWSPWLSAEPQAEVKVTDDSSSVGSIYSWSGAVVGAGEIEHRQLKPDELIEDELRITKPFRSTSKVAFELKPAGESTEITWHMYGSLPWFLFWMRSQMETFLGMDYDRGLKMLKEWTETDQVLSKTNVRGVESVGPISMAGVRRSCSLSQIGPSMEGAFAETRQKFSAQGLPTDGQAISVYHKFDMKALTFEYTSGFVIPAQSKPPTAQLSTWSIPTMQALCVEHTGSYEHLGNAWSAAHQVTRSQRLKQSHVGTYEVYMNDPEDTAPADLHTEIFLPLR